MATDRTFALLATAVFLGVVGGFTGAMVLFDAPVGDERTTNDPWNGTSTQFWEDTSLADHLDSNGTVQQFGSAEAFREYVRAGTNRGQSGFLTISPTNTLTGGPVAVDQVARPGDEASFEDAAGGNEIGRASCRERV